MQDSNMVRRRGSRHLQGDIRISPSYTVEHWRNTIFRTEADWQYGIGIFEERIQNRFLDCVDAIKEQKYSGFAVLALDSLLLETLQQFRKGWDETPTPIENAFVSFLRETSFREFFTTHEIARYFYKLIRNGLLHQGQVKGSSRVLRGEDVPLVKWANAGRGLEINRDKFHQELVNVYKDYLTQLKDASNTELRQNFRMKMNYICQVGPID
jgi:hypothetical protein